MIATVLAWVRYVIAGSGIAVGVSHLASGDVPGALHVVSLTTVGLVGLLGFVSHVVYGEGNAQRLGWESSSGFQLEVGFANLGFALVALAAYFGAWGLVAETAVVLGFGLYFVQAGLLFALLAAREAGDRRPALFRVAVFFLLGGWMLAFAVSGMRAAHLAPF